MLSVVAAYMHVVHGGVCQHIKLSLVPDTTISAYSADAFDSSFSGDVVQNICLLRVSHISPPVSLPAPTGSDFWLVLSEDTSLR